MLSIGISDDIHGNMKKLLGNICEVGIPIKFLKETGLFEDIYDYN